MKILRLTSIIVLFILCIIQVNSQKCKYSYECGNLPYSNCSFGNFQILNGIGYDDVNDRIYLLGTFSDSIEPYPFVVSLSGDINGRSILKTEYPVLSYYGVYTQVPSIFSYDSALKTPFIETTSKSYRFFGPYFPLNNTQIRKWNSGPYPFAYHRYNASVELIGNPQLSMYVNSKLFGTMDNIQYTENIFLYGGTTYYTIGNNIMYTGDAYCFAKNGGCRGNLLRTLKFKPIGLYVKYDSAYVGHPDGGLYKLELGFNTEPVKIYDYKVKAMVSSFDRYKLFITTQDNQVFKINIPDNLAITSVLLFTNKDNIGRCACINRFTGGNCQTCITNRIHWNGGVPECSIDLPWTGTKCQKAGECGVLPMATCIDGKCGCRPGFLGPDCSICLGSISWDLGLPTCKENITFI